MTHASSGSSGGFERRSFPRFARRRSPCPRPAPETSTTLSHHCWENVQQATDYVRGAGRAAERRLDSRNRTRCPRREIDAEATIPYPEIPYFPQSTVEGPRGSARLRQARRTIGDGDGRALPRLRRLYRGQVTFPIRVMKELGCRVLDRLQRGGGMNPLHRKGDLVVIEDHINLMGVNPLIGPNDDRLGPRFPDLIEPYDRDLQELALRRALEANIVAHRGVYVAVTGPNLETRAEYRFLRAIGADIVGMSTVPEVLVAVHAGMKVLGFSIVTDMCLPDALEPVEPRRDHRRRPGGREKAADGRAGGSERLDA